MDRKRYKVIKNLVLCILYMTVVNSHPMSARQVIKTIEAEEKQFPNGTVIGKYGYLDKNGNPVQVKYYADDSSYGVELNSIKEYPHKAVSAANPSISSGSNQAKKYEEASPNNIPAKEAPYEYDPFSKEDTFHSAPSALANRNNAPNSTEFTGVIDKDAPPTIKSYQKGKYKSPDYEVYAKNDIEGSEQQCGANKKVRVYNFVHDARKSRKVAAEEEEAQFCEF